MSHSQNHESCWRFCTKKVFARRSFYPQRPLHIGAFAHRSWLHRAVFTHKLSYIPMLVDTEAFTDRSFYTEAYTHGNFHTQKLKHRAVLCTQKLLHREAFTHRSLCTEQPLDRAVFTRRSCHFLETDALIRRSLYTQNFLHAERFLHREPFDREAFAQSNFKPLHIFFSQSNL